MDGDHLDVPKGGPIQQLLAPFFLGIVLNYFLWGAQVVQSYHYYKSYRETDKLWLKLAVCLLFVMDAVQTVFASQGAWRFMIDLSGDKDVVLQSFGWGNSMTPMMDSITASIVHFFYAHAILRLLNTPYNYIWTVIVLSLSFLQLVAGVGNAANVLVRQITVADFNRTKVWATLWLFAASVTDVLITMVMTWKLARSRTGFKETDDTLTKIIRMTMETGMATAVGQVAGVLTYIIWPKTSYCVAFGFIVPKLYSNSLMALLNSRKPRTHQQRGSIQDNPMLQFHVTQTVGSIRSDMNMSQASPHGNSGYALDDQTKSSFQNNGQEVISSINPAVERLSGMQIMGQNYY